LVFIEEWINMMVNYLVGLLEIEEGGRAYERLEV
jgi:hypothetical protein